LDEIKKLTNEDFNEEYFNLDLDKVKKDIFQYATSTQEQSSKCRAKLYEINKKIEIYILELAELKKKMKIFQLKMKIPKNKRQLNNQKKMKLK